MNTASARKSLTKASYPCQVGIGERGSPNNSIGQGSYTGSGLPGEFLSLCTPGSLTFTDPKVSREEVELDVLGGGGSYLDLVANPHFSPEIVSNIARKGGFIVGSEFAEFTRKLDPENRKCGCWSLVGQCANGHGYAKKIYCGREWCEMCRDQVHNRRIARWLPKVQQLDGMGYLVITWPEEVLPLLCRKMVWRVVGRRIASALREEGFDRGLRRWHWFGDKDHDFRPHLNVIVEAKHLSMEKLERVKDRVKRAALRKPLAEAIGKDCVVHYSYTGKPGKMYHILKYVTRATFLDREWDERIARELWNFRNCLWWGKWNGEAKWQVNGKDRPAALAVLEKGICPKCGEPVKWASKPVDSIWLMIWSARHLKGGYYELPDT